MSSRNSLMSLAASMLVLVAILTGCISGTTVRTSANNGSSSTSPTPTASVGPSGSATPVPSASPGAGSQTILDTGRTNIFDVCIDTVNAYYSIKVNGNSSIMSVPLAGGTPLVLASGSFVTAAWGVACDSGATGFVYYTDNLPNPQGTVWRVPKPVGSVTQGNPIQLGTGLNFPTFIRLNNVGGGDGLLYTCENIISSGRVLRYLTSTASQTSTSAQFITDTDNTPPYNLQLFSVGGVNQVWYTLMASDLTTGAGGEIRFKSTSAAVSDHTQTTQVGAGLLNPTSLTVDPFGLNVYWTEYDLANGGVRVAPISSTQARGTSVGLGGPATFVPPAAIIGGFAAGAPPLLAVTRNAQEANGGGIYIINASTNTAVEFTLTVSGAVEGGTNFPFQFTTDGSSFYVTEFNFSQGANGLATQPSRLVKLTPPTPPP